ncbi:MAG: 3-isopropylmalate dehydratase small subunit [Porticoccaceae bacterium]|nr:3-isopropylmalate dehydratase small subunit [Porticoccaceae bacterium]MDG2115285.1 3-isopropylmalate dehydratase small subunit [Porticoccaceae bacterium]|tara:strand:- start:697 stop:1326 length:630 start_codon:yes stop_codon:yes gene_type:complete
MEAFNVVIGKVAPMLAANIDTDVIMPKQFLKGIDRKGLDRGVFFDQRFLASGDLNPDFVLNQTAWRGAKFLAVGPNFGCGSSREHAVWGLKQLGIRALIGTTYSGIFYDNCQRNGLLAIELDEKKMSELARLLSSGPVGSVSIDLPAQKISLENNSDIKFEIDSMRKEALLLGMDAIGSTLMHIESIDEFERRYLKENPWLVNEITAKR